MRFRVLMFSDVSQCSLPFCSLSVVFSAIQIFDIAHIAHGVTGAWGYLVGYAGGTHTTNLPDGVISLRLVSVAFSRTDVCTSTRLTLSDRKKKIKYEYCRAKYNKKLRLNNPRVTMTTTTKDNFLVFILRFVGMS